MKLDGEWYTDKTSRILYATDASAYRELPLAVAIPKTEADLKKLIAYAKANNTCLIPRTAGTSLAGQVVGNGVVVDVSRYFTKILEVNAEERWVRVQPGVIRDDLNRYLKAYGLFFAPETSTANRAMIGGMVGNNSCGSNSVVYGSTREHLLSAKAILSDGSDAVFQSLSFSEFIDKCDGDSLEATIYRNIRSLLGDYQNQVRIREEFPKQQVSRRNTGYAIDLLLDTNPFTAETKNFNFCELLTGSEGTLAFFTELKLNLEPIPRGVSGLLCIHLNSISDALQANIIALKHRPQVSELIDHYILDCTLENLEQSKNRFFVKGNPKAILAVEYLADNYESVLAITDTVESELRAHNLGYHYPVLFGEDRKKVWELRKAGLGLLSNLPGDEKAVAVIEDTAVAVEDLPDYIREFNEVLKKYDLYSVHYAHAGSGELHLRPIINLKTAEGQMLFRTVATEVAELVKKYRGSLSGEHGDGRLRGEFIPYMIGRENYNLLCEIKKAWDPDNIFNPGKITATPPMDKHLRYSPGQHVPEIKTVFRFQGQNILQHAEQCNGSGDCRKLASAGGTMCPSYMATRNEKDTTRARANVLREILTSSTKINRFDSEEIKEVMELCISCKGCKSECPSSVDMAKLKAEFLHQYHQSHGFSLRSRLIGNIASINRLATPFSKLFNFLNNLSWVKSLLGFSTYRSLPKLHSFTLRSWLQKNPSPTGRLVYLFCDEFSNYNDVTIGIKAVELLQGLGYEVHIPYHKESGRAAISKGLLHKAKTSANHNVKLLSTLISEETPLIGIEPSAILTFRDEYPDLVDEHLVPAARKLALNAFLIEEFLELEMQKGNVRKEQFKDDVRKVKLHGHCQQKAWLATGASKTILSFPENYTVEEIPSGCCGMAGSFGYEAEHYEVSMQIGELVLFPAVRQSDEDTIIAAPGTSCRHQIKDGTGRMALHPVEILFEALK